MCLPEVVHEYRKDALQEPEIGQEKIDNLRTAAHELRHMTVLSLEAEMQDKAGK